MTYIIGEIGQNHNGSVDIAKLIIDFASRPVTEKLFDLDLPRMDAVKLTKRDLTEELAQSKMSELEGLMTGPGLRPTAVLFACGMNSVRSPMAEALTEKLFPGQIYVRSAGVRSGKIDPFVDAVMAEMGVDMSRHQPKTFEDLDESGFDLVG